MHWSLYLWRGAYRSEAVYAYSSNAAATQATGYVTSLCLILKFSESLHPALQPCWLALLETSNLQHMYVHSSDMSLQVLRKSTLLLGWQQETQALLSAQISVLVGKGALTYLQWSDFSCNTCGGQLSSTCLVTKQTIPQRSCPSESSSWLFGKAPLVRLSSDAVIKHFKLQSLN